MRLAVPYEEMCRAAYLADDIDALEFERLVESALSGVPTEIPAAMEKLFAPSSWVFQSLKETWLASLDREGRREYIRSRLSE